MASSSPHCDAVTSPLPPISASHPQTAEAFFNDVATALLPTAQHRDIQRESFVYLSDLITKLLPHTTMFPIHFDDFYLSDTIRGREKPLPQAGLDCTFGVFMQPTESKEAILLIVNALRLRTELSISGYVLGTIAMATESGLDHQTSATAPLTGGPSHHSFIQSLLQKSHRRQPHDPSSSSTVSSSSRQSRRQQFDSSVDRSAHASSHHSFDENIALISYDVSRQQLIVMYKHLRITLVINPAASTTASNLLSTKLLQHVSAHALSQCITDQCVKSPHNEDADGNIISPNDTLDAIHATTRILRAYFPVIEPSALALLLIYAINVHYQELFCSKTTSKTSFNSSASSLSPSSQHPPLIFSLLVCFCHYIGTLQLSKYACSMWGQEPNAQLLTANRLASDASPLAPITWHSDRLDMYQSIPELRLLFADYSPYTPPAPVEESIDRPADDRPSTPVPSNVNPLDDTSNQHDNAHTNSLLLSIATIQRIVWDCNPFTPPNSQFVANIPTNSPHPDPSATIYTCSPNPNQYTIKNNTIFTPVPTWMQISLHNSVNILSPIFFLSNRAQAMNYSQRVKLIAISHSLGSLLTPHKDDESATISNQDSPEYDDDYHHDHHLATLVAQMQDLCPQLDLAKTISLGRSRRMQLDTNDNVSIQIIESLDGDLLPIIENSSRTVLANLAHAALLSRLASFADTWLGLIQNQNVQQAHHSTDGKDAMTCCMVQAPSMSLIINTILLIKTISLRYPVLQASTSSHGSQSTLFVFPEAAAASPHHQNHHRGAATGGHHYGYHPSRTASRSHTQSRSKSQRQKNQSSRQRPSQQPPS